MIFIKNKKGINRNDALFILLTFIALTGTLIISSISSPTGFAVFASDQTKKIEINDYYEEYQTINLDLENIKRISITGTYTAQKGDEARLYVKTDTGAKLLLAELVIEESSKNTISSFTTRVTDQIYQDEGSFEEDAVVDEDEDVSEEDLRFLKEFEELCAQTCNLLKVNLNKLIIEVNGGEIYIKEIIYVQETQEKEELINEVKDIKMNMGEIKTINAAKYFEGEDLVYGAKSSEGYSFTVKEDEITFEALKKGEWESLLYALEGDALIISNNFNIIIKDEEDISDDETIEEPSEPEYVEEDKDEEAEKIEDEKEIITEPKQEKTKNLKKQLDEQNKETQIIKN